MMMKGLCLLIFLTVVCCKAKKCCFPQNWQLRQSSVDAYADNKSKKFQTSTSDIYFDSVENKIRFDVFTSKETTTIIELFKRHVGFKIVNNKKCSLFVPGPFPPVPICIPDKWTWSGHFRLGFKPSINVTQYGQTANVSNYVSLTDNCVPVSSTSYGFPNSDSIYIHAALLENYLPDIPDRSVFHVPAICKHAVKDSKLSNEQLHEKMFWRKMFAEN